MGLDDQFHARTVDLFQIDQFCTAVDKNGEDIIDSNAHLTCYNVRSPRSSIRPPSVISEDQLERLELTVQHRRSQLCVPSQATLATEPTATPTAPPATDSLGLDYYELYKTRPARGAPRFVRTQVGLEEPFLGFDDNVLLKKPVGLGVPTNRDGMGISNAITHLNCYVMSAPRFPIQDVRVDNAFGSFLVTVRNPHLLCVPSFKELLVND